MPSPAPAQSSPATPLRCANCCGPATTFGYARPATQTALADAIVTLRDDDLRRAIAERGHARFRETASLDALAHDLAAIVGELR